METVKHPSLKAANEHWRNREYATDGHLSCVVCDERTPHASLVGYTRWRCRCEVCRKANSASKLVYGPKKPPHIAAAQRAAYMRRWDALNQDSCMVSRARRHARERGVPFALTKADIFIPCECPVCGVELARRNTGTKGSCLQSPSLDRLIPELGYVPGNVWVLCQECNTRKGNMSVAYLRHLADVIERRLAGGDT